MTEEEIRSYYNRYFKRMVLIANQYVNDIQLSQDLAQDVFVRLIQKEEEAIDNPKAYFFQAIRNKSLDALKLNKVRLTHDEVITKENDESYYENALEYAELVHFLMNSIDQLPDRQQQIFKKSRVEGKSNSEIAEELGLSRRTIETQISKALKTLREQLSKMTTLLSF